MIQGSSGYGIPSVLGSLVNQSQQSMVKEGLLEVPQGYKPSEQARSASEGTTQLGSRTASREAELVYPVGSPRACPSCLG